MATFLRQSLVAALILGFTSCATIVRDKWEDVEFTSDPPGAAVYLGDTYLGETPVTARVHRDSAREVAFHHPDYRPRKTVMERTVSAWLFGNIVFGGVIGVVIDCATDHHVAFDDVHIVLGTGNGRIAPRPSRYPDVPVAGPPNGGY